jgi:hypothetical protein
MGDPPSSTVGGGGGGGGGGIYVGMQHSTKTVPTPGRYTY